jgi:hypothetical protein
LGRVSWGLEPIWWLRCLFLKLCDIVNSHTATHFVHASDVQSYAIDGWCVGRLGQ